MAKPPLGSHIVHKGTIYLRGTVDYPDTLDEALRQKQQTVKKKSADPIFKGTLIEATTTVPQVVVPSRNTPAPPDGASGQQSSTQEDPKEVDVDGPLPDDFPFKDVFDLEGYTTIQSILDLGELTSVPNIGAARALNIKAWLDENGVTYDWS